MLRGMDWPRGNAYRSRLHPTSRLSMPTTKWTAKSSKSFINIYKKISKWYTLTCCCSSLSGKSTRPTTPAAGVDWLDNGVAGWNDGVCCVSVVECDFGVEIPRCCDANEGESTLSLMLCWYFRFNAAIFGRALFRSLLFTPPFVATEHVVLLILRPSNSTPLDEFDYLIFYRLQCGEN